MPLEGLGFVKTSATFGIINAMDSLIHLYSLRIGCLIWETSNSLSVLSRRLKKIYRVEHFRANVEHVYI